VTLEDLLEEIVGEIEDEFDMPDDSIERVDDQTVRVDGTFPIDDFNEQFAKELPHEDYHTLAGFVFGELGRAPEAGDEITWDGLRFQVVETDGPRIEQLRGRVPRRLAPSAIGRRGSRARGVRRAKRAAQRPRRRRQAATVTGRAEPGRYRPSRSAPHSGRAEGARPRRFTGRAEPGRYRPSRRRPALCRALAGSAIAGRGRPSRPLSRRAATSARCTEPWRAR